MSHQFDTLSIHSGASREDYAGSVAFPIFQTSTYAQIAPGVTRGFCYSRTENPTRKALEETLAALEGARHGFCFASGMAAISSSIALLSSGDHVVACQDLYGGAYRVFTKVFRRFGIEFSFVDTTRIENIEESIRPNTKLLWLESPSNPLLKITDIAGAASAAHRRGVIVVVDNTFATPYLQRPFELGADIVLHSTTKYLNGHSDVIGGALLTNDSALAERLRFLQNAMGAVPGPQDCFLTLRGIKTLGVRMDRHCENARRVAEFLESHPKVAHVHYPGLTSHPGHELARRQQRDFGAVISVELKADVEEARRFTTRTNLFTLAESLGSVVSLLCHPPTMTHASVEPEVRRANGISDGLIRLSVGLEDADDLIADLDQALAEPAGRPAREEATAAGGVR